MSYLKLKMVIVVLCFSSICLAENTTPVKENLVDAVKSITSGGAKKERKKKAEMCSECGKPESECECKDHKEEIKGEMKK